jgi:succinyl-CoA synthetase beta subunit
MSVKGFPVKRVLVTEKLDIRTEYYMAITIDRRAKAIVLITSDAGGMDIEEIAATQPEKIQRVTLGADSRNDEEALAAGLVRIFPQGGSLNQAVPIGKKMYRLFREKDCSLVEINPLIETDAGELIAADAKIVFDENALFRHAELESLRNPEEYTADETDAKEAGLSFVSLSGEIGCMVNGAGLAMATMDGIKLAGSAPANFLDVGGSSSPEKVLNAMRILLRNKDLKAILINIFGGITRCDDIAEGILLARQKLGIELPIVIRLIGTNEEKGREMLSSAGLIVASDMTQSIRQVVACVKGGSAS